MFGLFVRPEIFETPASTMPAPTVLHYLGYDCDVGGIVSVVRTLAATELFPCVLGVNRGFKQRREPPLPVCEFSPVLGETIGPRNAWVSRRAAKQVRAWLRADPLRVVHARSRAGTLVAWWLAGWGERRFVASVHCYGSQRWFYRHLHRRLGPRLYFLSPEMRRYYGLPDAGWSHCVPDCVFVPEATQRRREHDGVLRLGGIGSLVEWKGWDLVLSALAALSFEDRARVRFDHIGGPLPDAPSLAYADRLRRRTHQLGLEPFVTWRGLAPNSEALLGSIDALVVPSYREPFSVSLLEALVRGVPVVAADSGGPRDIIHPPKNGWLFRTGDSEDLRARLKELLDGDALRHVQIDQTALQRHTAPAVASQLLQIYASLLAPQAG